MTITVTRISEKVLAEIMSWGYPAPRVLTEVTLTFSSGNTYVGQWNETGLRAAYIDDRITLDELEAALGRMPRTKRP